MWIWTGLPWSWVIALTVIVANAVILLHLLRPQPRRIKVITTMFWQEAGAVVHGGRLGGKPSQWLSLLLLLLALLLGALALLSPLWISTDTQPAILLIDNGLPSDAVESFDTAVDQLVSTDQTAAAIIAASPLPRVLQAPGQADGRWRHRLAELPSTSAAATGPSLQLADALSRTMDNAKIIIVTAAAQRWHDAADALAMKDDVQIIEVGQPQNNTAIIGATWRSDRPLSAQGTLTVRIGAWLQSESNIQLRLVDTRDDNELAQRTITKPAGASQSTESFDLPAQGQQLRITIESQVDALAADNTLNLTMPARQRVSARIGVLTPIELQAALESAGCVIDGQSPTKDDQIELLLGDDVNAKPAAVIQIDTGVSQTTLDLGRVAVRGTGIAEDIQFDGVRLHRLDADSATTDTDIEPIALAGDQPVVWLTKSTDDLPVIVFNGNWFAPQSPAAAGGFAVMLSRAVSHALHIAPELTTTSAERSLDDLPWLSDQTSKSETVWLAAPGSPSVSNLLATGNAAETSTPTTTGRQLQGRSLLTALAVGLLFLSWWLYERGRIA